MNVNIEIGPDSGMIGNVYALSGRVEEENYEKFCIRIKEFIFGLGKEQQERVLEFAREVWP